MITTLIVIATLALLASGSFIAYKESKREEPEESKSKYTTVSLMKYLRISPVILGLGLLTVVSLYLNDGIIGWQLALLWFTIWFIGLLLLWGEAPAFVEKFDKNFYFGLSMIFMVLAAGAGLLSGLNIGIGIDNSMLLLGVFIIFIIGCYVSGKEARTNNLTKKTAS